MILNSEIPNVLIVKNYILADKSINSNNLTTTKNSTDQRDDNKSEEDVTSIRTLCELLLQV
jgi:hypothetical protein